ncbi:MAG TPA: ATP-binding protein [Polyangium sp.]|nr:ATP-binding protein [Polyangium sp.]
MSTNEKKRRRTVAGRLLASYVLVLVASTITVGWSLLALRDAARDAALLRNRYVPLVRQIDEALADQNLLNLQLNHITAAKNPGDIREWIETARRTRPLTFAKVRKTAELELDGGNESIRAFQTEVVREASAIEKFLTSEPERFGKLFQALNTGDSEGAEKARNEVIKRETDGAHRLRAIRVRVEERMDALTADAKRRETRAMQFLLGLFGLTLFVGIAISIYARRVLAPLTRVTERAEVVARGDLTPREIVATNDEIGELATTFEGMVAAILRARSELVNAERLAAIGKMAAHVTHEIRNPLSSIGLNLELLEEEVATRDDKEAAQLVGAIRAEVERLSKIAEQYLSIARRPKPSLERERVEDLVQELLTFVRPELERGNVTHQVNVDPDLPDALVDESLFRQALLNLVRNAREAMSKGGELVINLRTASDGGIDLSIEDTGSGVPEELRASIFDPFFTTKQRGTGLGLAVTRDIFEAHRGTIRCEGREGGGTRFAIHLPKVDEGLSSKESAVLED